MIRFVPPHEIEARWDVVREHIGKCVASGWMFDTELSIEHDLHSGDLSLFEYNDFEGVVLASVRPSHKGYILHVFYMGGIPLMRLDDFGDFMHEMARGMGCRWITYAGRKGWRRARNPDYEMLTFVEEV